VENEEIIELSLSHDLEAGEEVTLRVLFEGQPVQDAVVSLNSEIIDASNEDGEVTFVVPTGVEVLVIEAKSSDRRGSLTIELGN
jgi:uncharacterized GH25 family protein